jgi:hypothetical protein
MPFSFCFCLAHAAVCFDNFCIVRRGNFVNPSSGKSNILTEERNYGITRFNTRCNEWEK